MAGRRALVVGLGRSGEAAAGFLLRRGVEVLAVDDDPGPTQRQAAARLGIDLVEAPSPEELGQLARRVDDVVVSPGVPYHHPLFSLGIGENILGEIELASRHATFPLVAVTGTNGKTTVATLVSAMLEAAGKKVVLAGNVGTPLIEVVDEPADVAVVEVSSFQLALTSTFEPRVGTWLNFAPDHLDWHPDLCHYRRSKERIWAKIAGGDVAVANLGDQAVAAAARRAKEHGARLVWFCSGKEPPVAGDDEVWTLKDVGGSQRRGTRADGQGGTRGDGPAGRAILAPSGEELVRIDDLPRRLPHDLANALAASATAASAGGSLAGSREVLMSFEGLAHRVQLVGEKEGVSFYDDSKATTPASVMAALEGFDSVVLLAGGRNKGLDLSVLRSAASFGPVHAVVTFGEAARELEEIFDGACRVVVAGSMEEAVESAMTMAKPGDAVLLSPGCASFDWYASYAKRGEDFVRCLRSRGVSEPKGVSQ